MNKEDLDFINSRSWYQTIEFEADMISRGCKWCGEPAWENIVKLLPKSLEGKRVLDLGCNAGLFCVKAALMGAKEVVGVDWPGWRPDWDFAEQREFVKGYFERKFNRKFPITYHSMRMEDFLKSDDIGYFDYALAIASIYYTNNPQEAINDLSLVAENVIVRLREISIVEQFTKYFFLAGFKEKQFFQEKWWEKLNIQTDDFYMYLYGKDVEVEYYRFISWHKELTRSNVPVNIWQLMHIVGTETPIEKYEKRIPEEFITYVPLKELNAGHAICKLTEEQKKTYPWIALGRSIKDKGFLIPVIVEEIEEQDKKVYVVIEGKHRAAALATQELYDPDFNVPCVIVKKVNKNV